MSLYFHAVGLLLAPTNRIAVRLSSDQAFSRQRISETGKRQGSSSSGAYPVCRKSEVRRCVLLKTVLCFRRPEVAPELVEGLSKAKL